MKPTRSLDRSVVSYTITAGAVLAASAAANAQFIIYSGPQNVQVGAGGFPDRWFDLDGNSVYDFRFFSFATGGFLGMARLYGNSVHASAPGAFVYPRRLATGVPIGPALSPWQGGDKNMTLNTQLGAYGYFNNDKGYIGVRFYDLGVALHYGWIQFVGGRASGTIVDWAYERTPNTPILAGAMPVPEPAQAGMALGLLALGAAGVRRMRQMTKTPAHN
jgi:MYXO-CTERM domain-containing protein